MLVRAPASPAQGLHHHGPRYFNFPYFCTMCGLEKLGIVDKNWLERICDPRLLPLGNPFNPSATSRVFTDHSLIIYFFIIFISPV